MRPLALHLEDPHPTETGWAIVTHPRYEGEKLPTTETIHFTTEQDARDWHRRMRQDGAWEVRTDFKPGARIPRDLPTISVRQDATGLTLQIDGQTVAAGVQSTRELKREILDHPRGHYLIVQACTKCHRKPKVNLLGNTLTHVHGDCPTHIVIDHWALPLELKIAAWNILFAKHYGPVKLDPATLPQLEVLGVIRPPTSAELVRRITNVEIL